MSTTQDDVIGSFRLFDREKFLGSNTVIITLGISHGRVWADAVSSISWASEEEVRASYYHNGPRNDVLALHYTRIIEPLGSQNSVKIEIEGTRYVGQSGFHTRISRVSGVTRESFSERLETRFLEYDE